MPDNAQDTILREWAGGPGTPPGASKPLVRPIVLNMTRVDQSDEDIDVDKESRQRSSSRS